MSISISPHGTFWKPRLEADKREGYPKIVAASLGLSFGVSCWVAVKRLTGTWERLASGGAGGALLAIPVAGAAALLYRTGVRSAEGQLRQGLGRWCDDPSVEGNKQAAREEIVRAFVNQLDALNLSNLGLTSLPPEMACLSHLEQLNLQGNPLGQLPDWVGDFEKLARLYLSDTQLEEFPPAIARLKELILLRMNRNRLESLPDEIGNLTKLQSLAAEDNVLTRLPDSMSQLRQLNELKVARNPQLTEVAASIFTLPQLRMYSGDLEGTAVQYEVDHQFSRVTSVTLRSGEKVQSNNWPNFAS